GRSRKNMVAMHQNTDNTKTFFFRRYPALTLSILTFILIFILLKISDAILYQRALRLQGEAQKNEQKQPLWIFGPINRVIRLREQKPMMNGFVKPTQNYLSETENLEDKEYYLHTDNDGFIILPDSLAEADKIFFIGGSTTECLFVDEDIRFPAGVQKRLSEKGLKVKVYNAGVSGNNSLHNLNVLLNKILPYRPKAVVWMECVNDLNVLAYEGSYWNKNINKSLIMDTALIRQYNAQFPQKQTERPEGILKNIFPYLSLRYAILKNKFRAKQVPENVDEWAHVGQVSLTERRDSVKIQFKNTLKTFIEICKAWNIQPILMTQQNRLTANPEPKIAAALTALEKKGINYQDYHRLYVEMNEIIRQTAKNENVLLIDLDKEIPKTNEFIYDAVHVNNKGAQLATEIITKNLLLHLFKIN
ncbi:MAG: SGNH/GDSL hydrolase family protein, partial [Chitinophagales bacterium]|nr:SGNH/GDSL hydrolase family protein [Chitinophagales bacterium]MDW8274230.1 SGNH/GDSL hydrolase family protein [Chitinophagales bacterium]